MKLSISFVIPAYNDEATIEKAVIGADSVGKNLGIKYEIIVINDSSSDKTEDKLREISKTVKSLKFSSHEINKGYGETIKELYYLGKYNWIFSIPGDLQIEAKEVLKLIPYIQEFDMIVGRRIIRSDIFLRKLQSRVYNMLLRFLLDVKVQDVNSVRLMNSKILKKVKLKSKSAFVDAELTLKAQKSNFKIIEVPISHKEREGTKGGGGSLRIILPTIVEMLGYFIKTSK